MANSQYLGQYGESLRRLSALNMGMPPQPQNMGGADLTPTLSNNATGALPPPAMPGQYDRQGQDASASMAQSGAPAGALPPPAAGAQGPPPMSGGALPAPGGEDLGTASVGQSPSGAPAISFTDMVKGASHAHKEAALKNLEKHVNIDDEFAGLQEHGIVPQDAKMSRHDKGMLVLEFGLRMMSAAAQGADAMGAAGIAGQGLLESYRATKDADKKEATRQDERAQDRTDRQTESTTRANEHIMDSNQRETASLREQAGADRRNTSDNATRLAVAEKELAARKEEARLRATTERQPVRFTDQDGTIRFIDADGRITTPTDKAGKPGRPMQRADASGLDQDKVQGLIEAEKKRLATDPAITRDLRGKKLSAAQQDAYLEKQARANIMGRLPVGTDSANPLNLDMGK